MMWRFLEARAGLFWLIFNPISRNWVTLPRNNQPRHRWGPTDQSQGSSRLYISQTVESVQSLCLKTAKAAVTPNLMREGDTKYFHVKRLKYFHGKGGESRCGRRCMAGRLQRMSLTSLSILRMRNYSTQTREQNRASQQTGEKICQNTGL